MDFKILDKNNKKELVALFKSIFSSYEGEEGKIIGNLASELSTNTNNKEIIGEYLLCQNSHL